MTLEVPKKKSLLPHGFKANAERISVSYRKKLDLNVHDPLCGFELAKHLNIEVYRPAQIFPPDTNLEILLGVENDDNGWSALTMNTGKGNKIIIHNNLQAPVRQQSNLMHELSHVICEHKRPNKYEDINLPFFMRDFDAQQEEEANYLGSTLQIPREALLWALKRGMTKEEIGDYFQASISMVTFRINSTGVMRQLSYMRR